MFGQRVVHEDADGSGTGGEGHGLGVQGELVVCDLDADAFGVEQGGGPRLGQVDLVIRLG